MMEAQFERGKNVKTVDSMINVRPRAGNRSHSVEDAAVRGRIVESNVLVDFDGSAPIEYDTGEEALPGPRRSRSWHDDRS